MSLATAPTYVSSEWYSEVPRSVWRIGLLGILLMTFSLGGFGYWAFSAPLAAAVVAPGSFVATGRNKIVQHLEGGIIAQILVEEGEEVEAGQPLVTLDTTAAETRRTELQLRRARLEAMKVRLMAEYDDRNTVIFPPDLRRRAVIDPEIEEILLSQKLSFDLARDKLDNDIGLVESNILAQTKRIQGYIAQRESSAVQVSLLKEDRVAKADLLNNGLTRKSELNALERAIVDGVGQMARLEAEIAESEAMIIKFEKQILQTRYTYTQAALDELHVVQAELDSVKEQVLQAEDVLRRTEILAPVDGTILRMHYHTSGGVIESGKPIVEILPKGAPLIIETLIPRNDIDSVQLGQYASVRLVALNQRTTPILDGEVFYISADAIPDTAQGPAREVYVARISLEAEQLRRVDGFAPTPGMPAEILIATRERTFMQYLTKPIVDSMSRAFRED
ncbi:HlyD family type I secretion periplasmic adaptor subunit [Vannielia litorea]|uniref:Membrane fusion protein (MFP) family protein n=1 Tax=Vannielia litorea TaxID=1217970 RepID=A0A1N6E646_9RHOB|nr:HlyD family type I secretion periplasmic adaptor subunit [Vannielia litorea]SIN78489.1 HlyD family secretion protein [Vannielia litorea]